MTNYKNLWKRKYTKLKYKYYKNVKTKQREEEEPTIIILDYMEKTCAKQTS